MKKSISPTRAKKENMVVIVLKRKRVCRGLVLIFSHMLKYQQISIRLWLAIWVRSTQR